MKAIVGSNNMAVPEVLNSKGVPWILVRGG